MSRMDWQSLSDRPGFRILYALCSTTAFCMFFFAKTTYGDKIVETLMFEGYRDYVYDGPLTFLGNYGYLLGLPIFILVFLLPNVVNLIRKTLSLGRIRLNDGNLSRCLYIAVVYWIFSGLSWLVGRLDFLYLSSFIAVGGLYGIVEGVWKTPLHPRFLDRKNLTLSAKVELIKYEDNKWWRGLNLLWVVIVGIAVTGAISLALSPSPIDPALQKVPGYNSAQTAFLVLSAVPGIALLVWYFIKRTNYLHKQLEHLYRKSGTTI